MYGKELPHRLRVWLLFPTTSIPNMYHDSATLEKTLLSDVISSSLALSLQPPLHFHKERETKAYIYKPALIKRGRSLRLMQWSINSILVIHQPANNYSTLVGEWYWLCQIKWSCCPTWPWSVLVGKTWRRSLRNLLQIVPNNLAQIYLLKK
jgi:hypothetical protein